MPWPTVDSVALLIRPLDTVSLHMRFITLLVLQFTPPDIKLLQQLVPSPIPFRHTEYGIWTPHNT